jgi:hypothetical protein
MGLDMASYHVDVIFLFVTRKYPNRVIDGGPGPRSALVVLRSVSKLVLRDFNVPKQLRYQR